MHNPEFTWTVKSDKFLKILSDDDRKEPVAEDKEPEYVYIYFCVKVCVFLS